MGSRLAHVTDRIARATSTIRTRREDVVRDTNHGGPVTELRARNDETAAKVDKTARRITKILD